MSVFETISKLSFDRGVSIGLIIFGSVLTPHWFLYQFAIEVYDKYDWIKLLLLTTSIGVPPTIAFTVLLTGMFRIPREVKEKWSERELADYRFSYIATASTVSALCFYIPSLMGYLWSSFIRQHSAVNMVIWSHLGFMGMFGLGNILSMIDSAKERARRRKKEKETTTEMKRENPN